MIYGESEVSYFTQKAKGLSSKFLNSHLNVFASKLLFAIILLLSNLSGRSATLPNNLKVYALNFNLFLLPI